MNWESCSKGFPVCRMKILGETVSFEILLFQTERIWMMQMISIIKVNSQIETIKTYKKEDTGKGLYGLIWFLNDVNMVGLL